MSGSSEQTRQLQDPLHRDREERRARKPLYLKYGLQKAEYSSLAGLSLRVSRSHALSYTIRTKHSSKYLEMKLE